MCVCLSTYVCECVSTGHDMCLLLMSDGLFHICGPTKAPLPRTEPANYPQRFPSSKTIVKHYAEKYHVKVVSVQLVAMLIVHSLPTNLHCPKMSCFISSFTVRLSSVNE